MPKHGPERILIVGAGPVGLTAALLLAQGGVPVTVIEKEPSLPRDHRASTFHPPTLDLLEGSGITAALLRMGIEARTMQYRDRREGKIVEFDFALLRDDTHHPYRLQCEQFKLTAWLADTLARMPGVEINYAHELVDLVHREDRVEAIISTPEGEKRLDAAFLIGADGARSAVRKILQIDFPGLTYPERFLVLSTSFDFAHAIPDLCYVNYVADPDEWCFILRVPDLWRIVFPISSDITDQEATSDEAAEHRLQAFNPRDARYPIDGSGIYRVNQRVAATYRRDRVFLAGDAAHINNPLGGMGLNGGLHDAISLTTKLLNVWHGGAREAALDGYEAQRRPEAIDAINAQTARNKRLLEERDPQVRRRNLDDWRRLGTDPVQAHAHLLESSMIGSLRRSGMIE